MKTKTLIAAFASVLLLCSCGAAKKTTDMTDYNNGSAAGTVLISMANQYLADGKVDFANVKNILNLSTLANCLVSLKSESNQAQIDFGDGLMSTNANVTKENRADVLQALTDVSQMDLAKITNTLQRNGKSESSAQLSSALESVLKLLRQ